MKDPIHPFLCKPVSQETSGLPAPVESIRASSRKNRVYVFRQFLWETYGNYLEKGDIVLDVAGGKGDLSWLLTNIDDIDSVVVDPRLTKNHIVKSVRYLRQHPDEARRRAIPNRPTHQPLATLLSKIDRKDEFEVPRHLRILLDDDTVVAVQKTLNIPNDSSASARESWAHDWEAATTKAMSALPLGYQESSSPTKKQILDAATALETILAAKLIVGFHPDQATEACVDLAMALGRPFCIVPCCVFPSEFPYRKLDDGARVRCYNDLIQYLQKKCPSARTAQLNFHQTETAKNLVLYTLPCDGRL